MVAFANFGSVHAPCHLDALLPVNPDSIYFGRNASSDAEFPVKISVEASWLRRWNVGTAVFGRFLFLHAPLLAVGPEDHNNHFFHYVKLVGQ